MLTSVLSARAGYQFATRKQYPCNPGAVNYQCQFSSTVTAYALNLTHQEMLKYVDIPQTVFVDNSQNSQTVAINIGTTGQTIYVPALQQGFFPIFATQNTQVTASSPGQSGTVTVGLWFTNFKIDPFMWGAQGAGSTVTDPGLYAILNAVIAGSSTFKVQDTILEGAVSGGKVLVTETNSAAILTDTAAIQGTNATIAGAVSGGKMQVQDTALEATISGGKILTTETNSAAIATNTSNTATSSATVAGAVSAGKMQVQDAAVEAIISGGKLAVTDAVLEGTVINVTTNQLSGNSEGNRATFTATCQSNDVTTVYASLQGSATKKVRIKRIIALAVCTGGSLISIQMGRATANTGGTATTPVTIKFDTSNASAATAVPHGYNAAPALTVTYAIYFERR